MDENGNERYLRYILLLGEGVLLVLRGVVRREVQRTGLTLDAILTIPNNRRQIERNCHSETQRLHLFPSPTTVNSDIETWDISLLTLVIQRVFWSNLTRDERLRISYLRDSRNEYQGHPPAMSMEQTEYTTRSADLATTLQDLATGLDQQTRDTLTRIINDSNAVQFDFHTAIQHLQELYEFKEEMLRELETKFQDINTKLDTIQGESNDHIQMTRDMAALQSHMQGDLLDTKSLAEQSYRMASASSEKLDAVQKTVSSSREMNELQQETLRRIEQKITELMSHQRGRQLQHDVDANININSERPENSTEAQDVIVSNINDILKEIRPDAMEDSDNTEAIMQRVNELITRYGGSDYELTKSLLELIKEIIRHGHIQQARKGSIKLTVRFTSYTGLLSFVQYLNSEQFQDRLNGISRALKKRTGHVVTLSACIAQESLYDLHKHLEEECNNLKCTRSVVLPVQCKGIIDLNHIWKLLQMGGADRHLERLSEILTKIVGGKVTLTTSVNLKQFEQALLETEQDLVIDFHQDEKTKKREKSSVDGHSFDTTKNRLEYLQEVEKTKQREQELIYNFPGHWFGTTKNPFEYLQDDERTKQREQELIYNNASHWFDTTKNPLEYLQEVEKTKQREQELIYRKRYLSRHSFDTTKNQFEYLQDDEKTKQREKESIYDDESKPFKMRTDKVFCFSDDVETKKKEEEFKSDRFPKRMSGQRSATSDRFHKRMSGEGSATLDRFPKRLSGEGSALRIESSTGSEKDYERHLKLKHVGKYSVRCEEDRGTPVISETEVLPNGRILLTDWWNRNLKMLDSSFNVVSYCRLPGMPNCVSYIDNDTVVVGISYGIIVFVRVSGDLVIERLLKLDDVSYVHSLAFYGETLYICDVAGKVYTSTTDGHLQGVLYKSHFGADFPYGNCIAISDDGEMIYLTSCNQELVTINNKGKHLSTLRPDSSRRLSSICTVGDGTIFVLAVDSQKLFQVDYGGTKVLNVVHLLPVGRYIAMCYDRKHSRLIVSGRNDDILVYEHQK